MWLQRTKWDNTRALELPSAVKNYEYFLIVLSHENNSLLKWKLQDESGCEHEIPYFFKKDDISTFTIVPDGHETTGVHNFHYTLRCWLKELQIPVAHFYSISTVEILPQEKCSEPPIVRSRAKGEEEWINGARITFSDPKVRECQLIYKPSSGIIIQSPILEITCMVDHFNIESDTLINWETVLLDRKLNITPKPTTVHRTDYSTTIKLLEPIDLPDYNEERPFVQNMPAQFNARYEYRIHVENLQVSFSRTFLTPQVAPVDKKLWQRYFGEEDSVTFYRRRTGRGDAFIDVTNFVLHKHGAFHYKESFKLNRFAKKEVQVSFGGCFSIQPLDSENSKIELWKLFKNTVSIRPWAILLPSANEIDQLQVLGPLQLPELVKLIGFYAEDSEKPMYRLVCKNWYNLVRPTISGTISASQAVINGFLPLTR